MVLKKIEVKNGRLLSPQKVEKKGKWRFNKELVKSYNYKKWEIKIEDRLIKVNGPNKAEYNLIDGFLCLCSYKTGYNNYFYYSIFIDKESIRFLDQYKIDSVIEEDPNHLYPINAELLTDGSIEIVNHFGSSYKCVRNARCVLEYGVQNQDILSSEGLRISDLSKDSFDGNSLEKKKERSSDEASFCIMRSVEAPIIFEKFLESLNSFNKLQISV